MEKIIGRENELSKLKDYYQSEKSEFIAIYGRRYVGKTFLIRIFLRINATDIIDGSHNAIAELEPISPQE